MRYQKDSKGRIRLIIPAEEWAEMDIAQQKLLKLGGAIPSVAGGEETDDERKEREDREHEAREKQEREDRERREREEREKHGNTDDDDDDEQDYVRLRKDEAARLRREAAEAKRDKDKRDKEQKERDEKAKAEQGKFQEIADDRAKERDEAIKERDEAREELKTYKQRQLVTKVAKRLMFVDPDDAHLYLSEEEMEDEQRCERALKKVLKDKKHLKSKQPPTGVPAGGGGGGNGELTYDQISNMSQEELIRRKPEVDRALEALGREQRGE